MTALAASERQMDDAQRALVKRMVGSNVNPESFLATDYLNHFNEVFMLLEMIHDMPEMIDDIVDWQPKAYETHFRESGIADRDLAIEAFDHAPASIKTAFLAEVASLDQRLLQVIQKLAQNEGQTGPGFSEDMNQIRRSMDRVNGIIHARMPVDDPDIAGSVVPETSEQAAIDALFD